ncbi:MAG: TPM domain-containing protein [Verrucomicrobiales bacterium]
MISCPYCSAPLTETTPRCPHCQFDLAGLSKLLGPTPILIGGISDAPKLLSKKQLRKLEQARHAFQLRFPQSRLNIVLRLLPDQLPFHTLIFWLFNTAGLSEEASRRGHNRDLLIVIDPAQQKAGIMVGYGLEPFIPQKALDHLIQQVTPDLSRAAYAAALHKLLNKLTYLLASLSEELEANLTPAQALTQEQGDYDY